MILAAALAPYVLVLGIAQDGGYPQAGCERPDCVAARNNPKLRRHVSSLAIVDPDTKQRWLIDATPDFAEQWHGAPPDGILLTHAHIGHYLGLAQLGREVMGTHGVRVYAMPRMREFLTHNGPWDQLVKLGNIVLEPLEDGREVRLNERITVTPILVPHRDEYSETVGFIVHGPSRSIFWLPDIDKWEGTPASAGGSPAETGTTIESLLARVDVAYVDGTFHDASELPGRDLKEIPHPLMIETMQRLKSQRAKIRFIHLNQSNPALRDPSVVEREGFHVAREGERTRL
ncbi:MAG TPA: MBL fold metallo-hydrolase [Thermoanaerobaculia bacterium]|nr:MBL fold metallo-hydrolase [Thermoanaerobaculia bacterium]